MSQPSGRTPRALRFGDTRVWLGSDPQIPELREVIPETDVLLVVEKAGAFRAAHPRIRILFRDAPFLLVRRRDVTGLPATQNFQVVELPSSGAVYEWLDAPAGEPVQAVADAVASVNRARYDQFLATIAGFSRWSEGSSFDDAMTFVEGEVGNSRIWSVERRQEVRFADEIGTRRTTWNAIARLPAEPGGAVSPLYVVCAHLDAIGDAGGDAFGADDNATGCAALLEIARVFSTLRPKREIRLLFFGGEEQGLQGSKAYVRRHWQDLRARNAVVLNLDMIGHRCGARGVHLHAKNLSHTVVTELASAGATYVPGLRIGTTDAADVQSDHLPFLDEGIAAVMSVEPKVGNDCNGVPSLIHTSRDLLGHQHFDRDQCLDITRMVIAYLAERVL